MFNAIVYFKKDDNNKLYSYFAFLALDFEDFTYIFIFIVNANASAFAIFMLKFINIAFKKNKKTNFILILKTFYS